MSSSFASRIRNADRGSTDVDTLIVIFGDQLDRNSAALRDADPKRSLILMMEVVEEAMHVPSHKQRTALFLSAMRHFAIELIEKKWRVRYVTLDDGENTQSFDGEFARAMNAARPRRVVCLRPGEWRVLEKIEEWQKRFTDVKFELLEDGHFYLTPDEFAEWADGRQQLILETFYRMMRKRFNVLVQGDGEPAGGEWNFDKQNREPFKDDPSKIPAPRSFRPDVITREVIDLVNRRFETAPGRLDQFHWPVTRSEALAALRRFIKSRLSSFGPYQDAMASGEPWMYHSLISSSLNLKLLSPRECVAKVVKAYETGEAPISSVEGFVRQILGWREFIRGVYWREGRDYRARNHLRQHRSLPEFYWWGDEAGGMNCMRQCLDEVREHGYGHHIQRLMVTGNLALIAGVHPREVSNWYLAMYVDAVDWVTLPNTLGMVMHADGGVVGTKPYAASGRYIDRMSDYCRSCCFNPAKRTGDGACPFSTFYWDFLIANERQLARNPRMRLMLKNLDNIDDDERRTIQRRAQRLRRDLGMADIRKTKKGR